MQYFFLTPDLIHERQVRFPAPTARQILDVLRLKAGHEVVVLDGSGLRYRVRLQGLAEKELLGEVLETSAGTGESQLDLCLAFSLSRREKMDWIFQKGTELGVSRFQPFISSRSLVQKTEGAGKTERYEAIIREAAEQCERSRLPRLLAPLPFINVIMQTTDALRLIAWERGDPSQRLGAHTFSPTPQTAMVLVGPEGGFSPQEFEAAHDHGFLPISLGPRILRLETACLAAATLILHEAEKLI